MFKYSWEADIPDPDNILSSLFHSKSPTNRAFYQNPEVDSLIARAQNETDYRKRISLYTAVQKRIMEDVPVIPLNTQAYERVFQPYVMGFEGKALGDHYFSLKRVWFER
jgi:ABC-type transport system substrate-binding protein